jgi:hypothetical protein
MTESFLLFQYMSDLHLELFPGYRVGRRTAPRLVLAGDIGDPVSAEYGDFVADCAAKYELVLVVLGNHEAYGRTWAEAVAATRATLAARGEGRVVLLDRGRHEFPEEGLRVVGTTLWSHVPPRYAMDVRTFISDFRLIKPVKKDDRTATLGLAEYAEMHAADVAWLTAELALAEADGVRLLVVTHHAPSKAGTSAPKNRGGPLDCAFASDLDRLLVPPVAAWIHGHTHFSHQTLRKFDQQTLRKFDQNAEGCGVWLVANQRGYADNPSEVRMFDEAACITV